MSATGEKLKELRHAAGFMQNQIAVLLGVDRSTYAYYETGKTVPSITSLQKLCSLYSVPMDTFIRCLLEDGK